MKGAVTIWIWLCAWLNCAGWFLSAIHQLNPVGYSAMLAVGVIALWVWKISENRQSKVCSNTFYKLFRRFKKPFPLAFLGLSVLIFLGGAIHAPNNFDAMSYRLPRVLHWLAAGQWQWVHTPFPRLNNRACGMEWVSAPLISIFKTDRFLFLINCISFCFLPGLLFSVLTRLGVRGRVAWYWMWIISSGYCYVLQAGSISNDSFAAPFALAALDFALRARISKRPQELFTSILAAALLTSAKTGNLPLLLPWAIAMLPSLKILLRKPVATAVVCVMATFSSFMPTAALNEYYCHDWSGLTLENIQAQPHTALRTVANMGLLTIINLSPPVFPEANQWNNLEQKTVPPGLNQELHEAIIEPAAAELQLPDMQMEENAGLGFGVTLLLLASVILAMVYRGKPFVHLPLVPAEALWRTAIIIAPWVSLLALLSKSEVYPIGRIVSPYYPLLLPLLLGHPGQVRLLKQAWWRGAAFLVFALAAVLLVISPARPLFPAKAVLEKLQAQRAPSRALDRAREVYSVYHDRHDVYAPVLNVLPPGQKVLGFITYDDPEAALWQPFGSRTVFCVRPDDSAAWLKTNGVEYILAKDNLFGTRFPDLDDWLKNMNAVVVQKFKLNMRASGHEADWSLVKLN